VGIVVASISQNKYSSIIARAVVLWPTSSKSSVASLAEKKNTHTELTSKAEITPAQL